MTLRTTGRQSHPHLHRGVNAILDGRNPKLLVVRPAFVVRHRVPVKRGRQNLLIRRVGKQVAGQLLDRKLVKWLVAIQRVDDPVAITPDVAMPVFLVPFCVGIPSQVEPHPRPVLTVSF